MKSIIILLILAISVIAAIPVQAGYVLKHPTSRVVTMSESNSTVLDPASFPQLAHKPKSGFLAYLSAGSAVLGLAIASPQLAFALIILGTLAGITGKMGLKLYRGRPFLRTLCIIGLILGAVVLAFGMVPLLFLTV